MDEIKVDPITGQEYIVIKVHCLACGKEVSPAEVEWDIFRNWGLPVHDTPNCLLGLAKKMAASNNN
jgi:hypothetical protein